MFDVSYSLLKLSEGGDFTVERAAFVIAEPDGRLKLEHWPQVRAYRSEKFYGIVPPNTIAIIHTHPRFSDPRPSTSDLDEARRVGLPFWVVSRAALYIAPTKGSPRKIAGREWVAQAKQAEENGPERSIITEVAGMNADGASR